MGRGPWRAGTVVDPTCCRGMRQHELAQTDCLQPSAGIWVYRRAVESFITASHSSRSSCVSPTAQLGSTEPVTLRATLLKRNWRKVSSQASFTSWLSFTQQCCVLGSLCCGQKVLWERLRAGCKCQKWLAHVPALSQHTWSPKEVPMIQRPPFLSEYTVPIWMAAILPGARQGFHMLNLVHSFPWGKCPGWGAQMRARVPSEGLSVQPLLNPSPASVQCQILRHPDSLKLKSVANDCGKCGSGKWLCCTQKSWLVMVVIAVVLIILICMNLFCIGSCNVLICSCWVPFLLHALISS